MRYHVFMAALQILWGLGDSAFADPLTPSVLLTEIYQNNAELKSMGAKDKAASALIPVNGALAAPKIALMRENSPVGSGPEKMDPMYSLKLSQEFMWPSRYGLMREMQKSKSVAAIAESQNTRLKLRKEALSTYYQIYASAKILTLLQTQKVTLREIARIAEVRRSAGQAPQQDEIKAHVEQTKIEMELILKEQEIIAMKAQLESLMNRERSGAVEISTVELAIPRLSVPVVQLASLGLEDSQMIKSEAAMLNEADFSLQLAKTNYYPEFMLSYTKPVSGGGDLSNYTLELQFSVPLWFAAKESKQVESAAWQKVSAGARLTQAQREAQKEMKMLGSQIDALSRLLNIYETTLIPQAITALNASRISYSAGRVGFGELLDAQRLLYSERMDYYRNLVKFIDNIVSLEAILGKSVSDLPFDGGALG